MSLMTSLNDPRVLQLAQKVYADHFTYDPKLELEYDDRRKKLMYEDILYNISFLMTAVHLSDEKIFTSYARWLNELLCNLMPDLDRVRIMTQMKDHYRILSKTLKDLPSELLNVDEIESAQRYIQRAIEITEEVVTDVPLSDQFMQGPFSEYRKMYLDAMLHSNTREAYAVISRAREQGVSILNIYENILNVVMYEVGRLWHQSKLTVDKEHYCSSVTQTVMSQFYDVLFLQPRNHRSLICCAVGSELHEIGGRMLSDLFEYDGWDTYYLGAAVPQKALLHAISEHRPDLIALSVTMPQHLLECESTVRAVRSQYPEVKIAVGGHAFKMTNRIWEKWPIDFYSDTAAELIEWSHKEFRALKKASLANQHD
ncbi:MAG: cobalamin-dependent protein [Erysipelotrichaceae bacterium]|nr:cobalamin-dependent protein [Erysipelotrichaceae bacterium]